MEFITHLYKPFYNNVMTIEKIKLEKANRMLRIGFGYNMYVPFFRIDLWYVGYRLIFI